MTNEATDATPILAPFQMRKALVNDDGVDLSGVNEYTLNYTYAAGENFPGGSGTLTLPASGALVTGPETPIGAELVFTEVLPEVPHATWQPAQITPNPLVITGGQDQAEVVVTNEIDLNPGWFAAVKEISTDDGIDPSDLPEVQLDYWYMDGETRVDAYLTLQPGGPSVLSPEIPVGSEVHFSEAPPATVPGIEWGTATISPNPLVIEADAEQDVLVTVTNPVTNPVELLNGYFAASKVVSELEGTGIAPSELPVFEVVYTWVLGEENGSGTISVANGQSSSSELIPLGAQVRVTEATPTFTAPGYEWGTR